MKDTKNKGTAQAAKARDLPIPPCEVFSTLREVLKDNYDPEMDLARAIIYEARHDTALGKLFYRYVDKVSSSSAGMLMLCDRESVDVVMFRMADAFAAYLLDRPLNGSEGELAWYAWSGQRRRDRV